jgi:hypothetical protein
MTNQRLGIQAVNEVQRTLERCFPRRPRNNQRMLPVALAACLVASLSLVGARTAQAKQPCSVAMPADPHGQWWSYRLIDGRKCWYEGKPKLPKSSLEWPKEASEQPGSNDATGAVAEKPSNPLDSQAWAPDDGDTFEARWHALTEQQ